MRTCAVPVQRFATGLVALTLLLGMIRIASAGVEFAPPRSYTLSQPATSVSLGDIDMDGDLDAVVGSSFGTGVEVFLNNGDGTFVGINPVDAPASADLVIANLVGDGAPDLATAGVDGTISVFRGLGGGGFEFEFSVAAGTYSGQMAAADLDGDGLDDLAVISYSGYGPASAVVLINRNGSFDPPAPYTITAGPQTIEAADLNGDGRPDLATGDHGSASALLNRGDGTFQAAVSYGVQGSVTFAAIGDLDGDLHPDLAVADAAGTMNALLNNGRGAFAFKGNTRLYGQAAGTAVADFDGDGHADVAVARGDLGQVIALAGRGDGTFLFPALYFATGMGAHDLAAGDVNGDGHPDLVTADLGVSNVGSMSVLISGALRTCARADLESGVGASGLVVADFNADGALDLAASNENNTLSVMMSDGHGAFNARSTYPLGTLSQNLAVGDLDGDSRPDLAASNFVESTVSLFYNRGDGAFPSGRDVRVGPHPRWVEVVDVDADGRLDLVTANYNDAIQNGSVSVLLGRAGRSFTQPVTYGVGLGPYMVRAANLNQDEMPDLVVNNYDGQTVSILLNRGDGTFRPEVRYAAGWNLSSAVADLDHDGDNDIAVTNFKENTVTILKNDGNGVFTRYADVPVGRNPRSVQAAIIKGDGDIDLAIALSGTSEVILLANDGSGGFTGSPSSCGVGVNPKTLMIADLDGNGGHDVVTANTGAGTVSVLLDVSPPGSARGRIADRKRPHRLDAGDPAAALQFALAMSRPNPAPGATTIPFSTPRECAVELRIYDVAGRAIRTLVDGTLPAGAHEAQWDGTTDRGDRARPGTYFYRLRAGDQQAVRTMMLR
jgi:hypothetical protein